MSINIDLNGIWKLTWCEIDGCKDVPACNSPIDAQVPGDVHLDLINANILPEPLIGANALQHRWAEQAVFSYEREFVVNGDLEFDRVEMVFNGLDCLAEVYIDSEKVGDSANAFVPHTFDVTRFIKPGKKQNLLVKVDTGVVWGKKQDVGDYKNQDTYERAFLRKSQFSFGWDWAPRLVTCGIWRDVELKLFKYATIRDVLLTTSFEGDSTVLNAKVQVESFDAGDSLLKVRVVRGNGVWQSVERVRLTPGTSTNEINVKVEPVERWYSVGLGDQALYSVEVELERAGEIIDDYATPYGFREVVIRQEPVSDGEKTFIVNVNGIDVFCRGANWVPADSLYVRITDEKYESLIKEALEANFNMFRVWGGGIYEDKLFYDLCDRYGILLWHDFMFACSEYPDDQDWYVENVRDEAVKAVKMLRNHPSMALWCGNNENDWMFGFYGRGKDGKCSPFYGCVLYQQVLPEVCKEHDPQSFYWPSSPYGGDYPNCEAIGDRHSWEVSIHGKDDDLRADVRTYRKDRGKFISEYGVLSYALPQTILDFTGQDKLDFTTVEYALHDNTFNADTYSTELKRPSQTDHYLRVAFGSVPEDGPDYIWQTLAYQAMGYREAISSFRMRKFDCAGSLFWMYSDCWGTHGWTIIDYYMRRKPSFYWVKKAYAPIAAFVVTEDGAAKTYVVNDTLEDINVCLSLECGDLHGKCETGASKDITVLANSVAAGPEIGCCKGYAYAWLTSNSPAGADGGQGEVISEDLILTHFPSEMEVPPVNLISEIKQSGDDLEVTITSDGFGHFVWLDLPDGAVADDNYFNLLPHRPKLVRVKGASPEQIKVRALNEAIG